MRRLAPHPCQRLEAGGGAFQRPLRVVVQALAQRHQEQRLAVGRALALAIEVVGDQRLDLAPVAVVAAELAVMHE